MSGLDRPDADEQSVYVDECDHDDESGCLWRK